MAPGSLARRRLARETHHHQLSAGARQAPSFFFTSGCANAKSRGCSGPQDPYHQGSFSVDGTGALSHTTTSVQNHAHPQKHKAVRCSPECPAGISQRKNSSPCAGRRAHRPCARRRRDGMTGHGRASISSQLSHAPMSLGIAPGTLRSWRWAAAGSEPGFQIIVPPPSCPLPRGQKGGITRAARGAFLLHVCGSHIAREASSASATRGDPQSPTRALCLPPEERSHGHAVRRHVARPDGCLLLIALSARGPAAARHLTPPPRLRRSAPCPQTRRRVRRRRGRVVGRCSRESASGVFELARASTASCRRALRAAVGALHRIRAAAEHARHQVGRADTRGARQRDELEAPRVARRLVVVGRLALRDPRGERRVLRRVVPWRARRAPRRCLVGGPMSGGVEVTPDKKRRTKKKKRDGARRGTRTPRRARPRRRRAPSARSARSAR